MIEVTFIQDRDKKISAFEVSGHAGYSESGSDIVCAATSVLVINTINCLDKLTDVKFETVSDEEAGFINCKLKSYSASADLLLSALIIGLQDIAKEYRDYLKIIIRREP